MLNYQKLMSFNPTIIGEFTNRLEQKIEFVEHPTKGDEAEVICICRELELASYSSFFETDDMVQDHQEYAPSFQNGKLYIGDFEA